MIKPKIYGIFCALALISALPLLTVRAESETNAAETASEEGLYMCGDEGGESVPSDNEGNTAEGEGNDIFPAYIEDIVQEENPVPATFDGAEMISPPIAFASPMEAFVFPTAVGPVSTINGFFLVSSMVIRSS